MSIKPGRRWPFWSGWASLRAELRPGRRPTNKRGCRRPSSSRLSYIGCAPPGLVPWRAGYHAVTADLPDEALERVKAPTLVIMGTGDPDFPDPAAEGKVLAEETGGTLQLVEGAGHCP